MSFRYGSMSFLALIFGYFCIPELKGQSLEQVEKIFETGVPLRKIGQFQSDSSGMQPIGAKLGTLDSVPAEENSQSLGPPKGH